MPKFSDSEISAIKNLELKLKPVFDKLAQLSNNRLNTIKIIKQALPSYFGLSQEKVLTLTEIPKHDQQAFDINKLKPELEQLFLLDLNKLQYIADTILPIKLIKKDKYLVFEYDKLANYPPEAAKYFTQLCTILTVYSLSHLQYEIYQQLLNHNFIVLGYYLEQLEISTEYLQQAPFITEETKLRSIYNKEIELNKEITEQFKYVNYQKDDFEQQGLELGSYLSSLQTIIEKSMLETYKKYPNTYTFWAFFDTPWHSLLKNIAANLFGNEYTWSTLAGDLYVYDSTTSQTLEPITNFYLQSLDLLPQLKTEYLNAINTNLNITLSKIRSFASINDINLNFRPPIEQYEPKPNNDDLLYEQLAHVFK